MTKATPATHHNSAIKDLQRIPGVGPSIANDLIRLQITAVADLCGRNPEALYAALYAALCELTGQPVDRCVLYVFRCAVWFAEHSTSQHNLEPEKLKWWYWKDAT